jgi:putative IMPACT (imprinted ancient) family translation regulator
MLDVLRHQDLEGVLATVVRYFGGIKLGAGGLVRAYTDSVAQALLAADKVAIVRLRQLRCRVPYPLEGLLRRELEGVGATLDAVAHADLVAFTFSLPEGKAAALVARLNEAGNGRLAWLDDTDPEADA